MNLSCAIFLFCGTAVIQNMKVTHGELSNSARKVRRARRTDLCMRTRSVHWYKHSTHHETGVWMTRCCVRRYNQISQIIMSSPQPVVRQPDTLNWVNEPALHRPQYCTPPSIITHKLSLCYHYNFKYWHFPHIIHALQHFWWPQQLVSSRFQSTVCTVYVVLDSNCG